MAGRQRTKLAHDAGYRTVREWLASLPANERAQYEEFKTDWDMASLAEPARQPKLTHAVAGDTVAAASHEPTLRVWSGAILERVKRELPFLGAPHFEHSLNAWVRSEARCLILNDWLDEVGLVDSETNMPRPQVDLVCKLEASAAKARERLGLDPQSYVQLERALAETRRAKRDVVDRLTTTVVAGLPPVA